MSLSQAAHAVLPDGQIEPARLQAASDAELMAALATGQASAFAEVMQRYLRQVAAVAQRMLANAADADEVAQEAFLRLWRQAPHWNPDGPATMRTWLFRVALNLCVDRLRRRHTVALDEADDIEDERPGAEQEYIRRQRQQVVQNMLLKLPERQRSVVVLAYFEELSANEIAAITGQSRGAVESLLVRARRGLRKHLEQLNLQGEEWFK